MAHPDRRAFIALTTTALVGVAEAIEPGRLAGALHGRRVDATTLAWLEARVDELRAMTNGGPEFATLVRALLTTTIQLVDNGVYDQGAGRRLHQVVAAAAQSSGWLHFDRGEYAAAQRQWHVALHAAHAAADRDLGAGVLSDLAYAATWLSHPDTAVSILEHARTRTRSEAACSLLDLRRARALAVLGDGRATGRALVSAEKALDRAQPGTAPSWVAWMSQADLTADAGRAWLDLGDPDRADLSLDEGLGLVDPTRRRTRSVILAYRAETALARHDIPAAAAAARTALDTALGTQAARCIGLARTTISRFEPYGNEAAARELYEYERHAHR